MTTPNVREINSAQYRAIHALADEGFAVTNVYSDGILRMERDLPNGDCLFTFIEPDGTYRVPRCWQQELQDRYSA